MIKIEPNYCNLCKGTLSEGFANLITRIDDQIIQISDIPAWICDNCNEAYYSPKSSRKIDEIISNARDKNLLVHPLAAGEIKFSFSA